MAKPSTDAAKPAPTPDRVSYTATPDVRVVYYATQDADGQFYAVRALVPVTAVIEENRRNAASIPAATELCRRDMEHISRLCWEADWAKRVYATSIAKDAVTHAKIIADVGTSYPDLVERANELRAGIASLEAEAPNHPKEADVAGMVMYAGNMVRRDQVAQHLQPMCEPIETREMVWNRLAAKREVLAGLDQAMRDQKNVQKVADPAGRYADAKAAVEREAHDQGQLTAWAVMAERWR